MKISLPWIVAGIAAVLLCTWKFSSRQPAWLPVGDFRVHSRAEIVTAVPIALTDSSRISPPPPTAIDEGLSRLERDVRRAAQIGDASERESVLLAACLRWAEFDPADALRIAHVLGLDQVSNAMCEDIIQKWAVKDFPAALAWASHEAAGEQRDHLMTRLAFVQSQTQPDAAARLVVEQIPAGPAQVEAGISVLHQWALRDFSAALTWVNSFSGELQDRGREELAGIARYRLVRSDVP